EDQLVEGCQGNVIVVFEHAGFSVPFVEWKSTTTRERRQLFKRSLKGRRTGISPVANSSPASLPGHKKSSSTCPGGCASLHHRLISVAPPGREIASSSLPAVSYGMAALIRDAKVKDGREKKSRLHLHFLWFSNIFAPQSKEKQELK
ncbi:MAG TPA: hypothetical protein VFV58_19270, partial [Blastocatellia bacterium]|nr:hypothetical protein [Blastocatellia bacterium]